MHMKSIVFLVSVATTGSAAYRAVHSKGKLFYVIDDFELERSKTPITKHHNLDVKTAASEILPLYSPLIDFNKFHNHGCYCSRFHPENPSNYNKRPLDSLDMICRDWIHMKTCLKHDENCLASTEDVTYEARHEFLADTKFDIQSGSWNISFIPDMNCDGNSGNSCLNDNCRTDKFFLEKIFEYFKASQGKPSIVNVYGRKAYDNPCIEDAKPEKVEHTVVHDFGKLHSGESELKRGTYILAYLVYGCATTKIYICETNASTSCSRRPDSNILENVKNICTSLILKTLENTPPKKAVNTAEVTNNASKIRSISKFPTPSLTDSNIKKTSIEASSKIKKDPKNTEPLEKFDQKDSDSKNLDSDEYDIPKENNSLFGDNAFQRNGIKTEDTYSSYDYEHYDGFYYDEYEISMKTLPVEQQVIRSSSHARGRIADPTQPPVVETTTKPTIPASSNHNDQCLRLRKITGL